MTVDEWLQIGIDNGWISKPVCVTHEGLPSSDEEAIAWDEGFDPCEFAVRLWHDV